MIDPRRRPPFLATGGAGDIRPGPTRADRSISSSSASVEDMVEIEGSTGGGGWWKEVKTAARNKGVTEASTSIEVPLYSEYAGVYD